MPYYINKATSSLYVNIPTWSCGSTEDFVIEIDYRGNTSGFNRPLGKNTGFVSRILIRHDSSPGFFLTNDAGTSASWPLPNGYTDIVNGGNFYKMRFVRTAGSVEFFFDGVSQGTRALSGIFSIERVFIQGGTHDLTNNAIKTLELTKTTDSRLYRGETGTGIEWPDSVSGQTGFVQNPTGTDAEWVLYSDGATYTLTADGGTFSYSGVASSLLYSRSINADGASYSYSGAAASLLSNKRLSADGASYSYSGGNASPLYNRALDAQGASFSYAGGAATLTYNAQSGATYTLTADGGLFSFTGGSASLLQNRVISADGAAFSVSGGAVSLLAKRLLTADGAGIAYNGGSASLLYGRQLSAEGSVFTYSGGTAALSYSGAVILQITEYNADYASQLVSAGYQSALVSAQYADRNIGVTYGSV